MSCFASHFAERKILNVDNCFISTSPVDQFCLSFFRVHRSRINHLCRLPKCRSCPGSAHTCSNCSGRHHTTKASPHDLADTWQGTLHAGQDLRTIVKITKDDKGVYKGTFYSIDQGGQGFNLDSVALSGQDVKFTLKLFNLTYSGKLSADGKTIDGSSSQGAIRFRWS